MKVKYKVLKSPKSAKAELEILIEKGFNIVHFDICPDKPVAGSSVTSYLFTVVYN